MQASLASVETVSQLIWPWVLNDWNLLQLSCWERIFETVHYHHLFNRWSYLTNWNVSWPEVDINLDFCNLTSCCYAASPPSKAEKNWKFLIFSPLSCRPNGRRRPGASGGLVGRALDCRNQDHEFKSQFFNPLFYPVALRQRNKLRWAIKKTKMGSAQFKAKRSR